VVAEHDGVVLAGRYRVDGELGRGAMGRVVRVLDEDAGGVPRACKILGDPALRPAFLQEYALARRLSHGSFPRAYALEHVDVARLPAELRPSTEGDTLCAVLELCEGRALSEVPRDAFSPEDLVELAGALLRAVDHLHRLGFAHGDLAPPNLLVDLHQGWRPGALKILDLGAAGPLRSGGGSTSGVLAYAAPERLAGAPLSVQSDLWSLGAVLFERVHGRHPWPGYPARLPSQRVPSHRGLEPSRLDPWLDRLLATDAGDRFPDGAAALAALAEVTGRPVETEPAAALRQRLVEPPFVDAGEHLTSLTAATRTARADGVAGVVCLTGAPGRGRRRLLAELADRLTATGARVVRAAPRPGEPDHGFLSRLVERAGGDPARGPLSAAQFAARLRAACAGAEDGPSETPAEAQQRAPVLVVELPDERLPDARRIIERALAAVARSVLSVPERWGATQLILSTDNDELLAVSREVRLEPWGEGDVVALLEGLFPGRRVAARVAGPLAEHARGNPALTLATLGALADAGALEVDPTTIRLDAEALDRVGAPRSSAEAAERLIQQVAAQGPARALAVQLSWARRPVPAAAVGDAPWEPLVRAGLLVRLPGPSCSAGPALTTSSESIARALRGTDTSAMHAEALRQLWERAQALGCAHARAEVLYHSLEAGDADAAEEAARALPELPPEDAVGLLDALALRGWPRSAAEALAGARAARATGDLARAAQLFERAAALAEEGHGSGAEAAEALSGLGAVCARASKHREALEALTRAAPLAATHAPDIQARVLAEMARSAVLTGRLEDAERWAIEGLDEVRDDPGTRGRLLYALGLVFYYRGEREDAAQAFARALEDATAARDEVEAAAVVTAQGLLAHQAGELEEAARHYERALEAGERAGDDARVLTALQNLGVVYQTQGAWAGALDAYREALALAEALDQPGRVMQLAGNLGNLWRYLGELDRASAALGRGLALAQRDGNRYMEAVLQTVVGEVALAEERWEDAGRALNEARRAAAETQSATEEIEALLDLTRLHLERQDYGEARESAQAALSLAQQHDNEGLGVQAKALLAAGHRASVHGDPEQADALAREALAAVGAVSQADARWPVVLEASFAARARGDLDEAARLCERVQAALTELTDGVPAEHRAAFQALRERRRARFETALPQRDEGRQAGGPRGPEDDRRWTRLLEINRRLSAEHDVKRLLAYILDSAILLAGAERGFILLADAAEGTHGGADQPRGHKRARARRPKLTIEVARNIDRENIRNVRMKISQSIAQRVIEEGEPILTVDAMEDERYREHLSVHSLRLRSVLCLPLRMRGEVLGAVYLDNRFRAGAFGEGELGFMEAFVDQAAVALSNARLLAEMERSRDALQRAQAEVEQLNAKLSEELARRTRELEDSKRVLVRQREQLVARHKYDRIIGDSPAIRKVFAIMDRLLDNTIPVLIEGESGTGKELVARAIHYNGSRRDGEFVAVNCGAIPANLLESELFGHVRGAFTGATSNKRGLFQLADKGSLLLDELGELPLEMQVKLLRVLQEGRVKPVGAVQEIPVDVRILAATNRHLEDEVAAGRFREDLYYRLSAVTIPLPPLRQRRSDIPLLVQRFLADNRAEGLTQVRGVSAAAMALLKRYDWPGNVRQLQMVLKSLSLFADGDELTPDDLAAYPDILSSGGSLPPASQSLSGRSLADIEREAIIQALRDNHGNKKRSAEQLGIDRRTLYNKLKVYGIQIQRATKVQ